jgi:hypothetical protein
MQASVGMVSSLEKLHSGQVIVDRGVTFTVASCEVVVGDWERVGFHRAVYLALMASRG